MMAEFKHTLRRERGSIIGWGVGLFLYSLMMVGIYPSMDEMFGDMELILATYPKEFLAFFPNMTQMSTPAGYLDTYFFSLMHLIVGIYVISAFAGLLTRHEEQGVLDLLLAQPVGRMGFFWGRVLGILASTALILLISWLGWLIPVAGSGLELSAGKLLIPYLPLLGILLVFGALALLFSMILPTTRMASGLTGALLVGNYLLAGLSNMNEGLKEAFKYTPMYFYQGGMAINELNWGWALGLLGIGAVLLAPAWLLFLRRDIRVGGERDIRLGDWFGKKAREA
jgi:ABC-2 type transport system permease protein